MRACVTVLVASLVLAACADSGSGVRSPLAAAVGYRWQVTGGTDASGQLDVAAGSHAMIAFTPDGYVFGDDTVNSLQGRYHETGDGYRVSDVAQSLVGIAGPPPRVMSAVDALFPEGGTVQVKVSGATLQLRRSHVRLDLRRAGAQGPMLPVSASSTATPSR